MWTHTYTPSSSKSTSAIHLINHLSQSLPSRSLQHNERERIQNIHKKRWITMYSRNYWFSKYGPGTSEGPRDSLKKPPGKNSFHNNTKMLRAFFSLTFLMSVWSFLEAYLWYCNKLNTEQTRNLAFIKPEIKEIGKNGKSVSLFS